MCPAYAAFKTVTLGSEHITHRRQALSRGGRTGCIMSARSAQGTTFVLSTKEIS